MLNKFLTRTIVTCGKIRKNFYNFISKFIPIVCRYHIYSKDKTVYAGYMFISLYTLNKWNGNAKVYIYLKPFRTYTVFMNDKHELLSMP